MSARARACPQCGALNDLAQRRCWTCDLYLNPETYRSRDVTLGTIGKDVATLGNNLVKLVAVIGLVLVTAAVFIIGLVYVTCSGVARARW
jgi:hypothetical protein